MNALDSTTGALRDLQKTLRTGKYDAEGLATAWTARITDPLGAAMMDAAHSGSLVAKIVWWMAVIWSTAHLPAFVAAAARDRPRTEAAVELVGVVADQLNAAMWAMQAGDEATFAHSILMAERAAVEANAGLGE